MTAIFCLRCHRAGKANPVVVLLLSGILLALVVLIVVTLYGKKEDGNDDGVKPGETAHRENLKNPPAKAKPVPDPARIQETLKVGKTYRVVLKAGFTARAVDEDWSVKQVTNLAYAAEMVVNRKIVMNDGHRVVELRHFEVCRNTKVLCDVEEVSIELGVPGKLLLGALDYLEPGTGTAILLAKPVTEALLRNVAHAAANSKTTEVFGHVDSLSGKTVRITYVDGIGVASIEPVGCSLTAAEKNFLFNSALLSDCHLMNLKIEPGGSWTVDASQIIGFLDPSMRGVPTGQIVIQRGENEPMNSKRFAILRVQSGVVSIDSSNASKQRIGSFKPKGTLRFNLEDSFIDSADLKGSMKFEEVSKDHILFKASFRAEPELTVNYNCQMQ